MATELPCPPRPPPCNCSPSLSLSLWALPLFSSFLPQTTFIPREAQIKVRCSSNRALLLTVSLQGWPRPPPSHYPKVGPPTMVPGFLQRCPSHLGLHTQPRLVSPKPPSKCHKWQAQGGGACMLCLPLGWGLTLHGCLVDLAVLCQPLRLRVLGTQRAVHSIPQVELGGGVSTVALAAPEDGQGELLPGKERKRSLSVECKGHASSSSGAGVNTWMYCQLQGINRDDRPTFQCWALCPAQKDQVQ